jgi:heme exporter protein A
MTASLGARPSAMAEQVSTVQVRPVVEVDAVGKAFGRAVILRDVTLAVAPGEAIALFGPNGAGKSTLLRVLATLMRPTSGTLRLFGEVPAAAALRRRIGVVAHQSFLYPDLTARENLRFYARMYGLDVTDERADAWLARVSLTDAADRTVRLFSRGMEQRLALARGLMHDPELVLLDEPWSGLDAAAGDWLAGLLRELRAAGRTVIVATHDFQRGLGVATRAIVLHRGRLAWETPVTAETLPVVDRMYREITGAVAA